jgi:hypothetical protein
VTHILNTCLLALVATIVVVAQALLFNDTTP